MGINQVIDKSIRALIHESSGTIAKIGGDPSIVQTIRFSANAIIECYKKGRKVFFCGNGGSASDSNHLAAEFSGRFRRDRKPLAAESLAANTSAITAIANDYGVKEIFSRQIQGGGKEGDVLVAISTSGASANVIAATAAARERKMVVIALTGESGSSMANCDHLICIPSTITARIQESHILVGHVICQLVEDALFPPAEALLFPTK